MLFTTTTQYVALAVALVAGWLFGLASHPGGAKWKQRYADEREVHEVTRKEQDARVAEANARVKDLERENARLAKAVPVAPVAATPAVAPTPPVRSGNAAGWFNWRDRAGTSG